MSKTASSDFYFRRVLPELTVLVCGNDEAIEHGPHLFYCSECHNHWCSYHARYTMMGTYQTNGFFPDMGFVCPTCHPKN